MLYALCSLLYALLGRRGPLYGPLYALLALKERARGPLYALFALEERALGREACFCHVSESYKYAKMSILPGQGGERCSGQEKCC